MKFPGMILMGAQSRLLPPSVPFRFFAAAVAFQGVAWGLIALDADQVPHFLGGPAFILAGIHALTLGVLVMTAIGASFQILPVVTGQSLAALWPCRLTFWLYAPGTALLVFGFIGKINPLEDVDAGGKGQGEIGGQLIDLVEIEFAQWNDDDFPARFHRSSRIRSGRQAASKNRLSEPSGRISMVILPAHLGQ